MSLDACMSFDTYEDVERLVGQELAKEYEVRLWGIPVLAINETVRIKPKPAKRRTRPLRRREILRERKARASAAKAAACPLMRWTGNSGTFTLSSPEAAVVVGDWTIEAN